MECVGAVQSYITRAVRYHCHGVQEVKTGAHAVWGALHGRWMAMWIRADEPQEVMPSQEAAEGHAHVIGASIGMVQELPGTLDLGVPRCLLSLEGRIAPFLLELR